ncbi:hypothetical protein K402DRAFT_397299 [Aulographum hederae CBS 113979]|uniref:C2H2-type domain-containing protein n=1 Tax=Aulographum hederae CBS 113979 TaxID=1176131 RepID=A0A6G1GP81_9PEZI|nr:hypothetical protein K402DRAFT_397299 [Aulographum hederae CBS 113979]
MPTLLPTLSRKTPAQPKFPIPNTPPPLPRPRPRPAMTFRKTILILLVITLSIMPVTAQPTLPDADWSSPGDYSSADPGTLSTLVCEVCQNFACFCATGPQQSVQPRPALFPPPYAHSTHSESYLNTSYCQQDNTHMTDIEGSSFAEESFYGQNETFYPAYFPPPQRQRTMDQMPLKLFLDTTYTPGDRTTGNELRTDFSDEVTSVSPIDTLIDPSLDRAACQWPPLPSAIRDSDSRLMVPRPTQRRVIRRIASQPDGFSCPDCSKTFSRECDLRRHHKTHKTLGERPYKCDICPKTFHWRKDLERHSSTHTREAKHYCHVSDCEFSKKGMARKDNLERHIRKKHLSS